MPEGEKPAPRRDDETDSVGPSDRWRGRAGVMIPALTFLVGLALGILVTMQSDSADEQPEAEPASPTASATPGAGDGDTVVIVPAACEDAAENISEAIRLLDDAAGSLRDFRPQELVDLLDQLEVLDQETRSLAADCTEVAVTQEPESSESPSESTEGPDETESP